MPHFSYTVAAKRLVFSGWMLDRSISNRLAVPCSRISLSMTDSTAAVSARHNRMTVDAWINSAMDAHPLAPALTTGIIFSGLRFHTLTLKPALSKRSVMGLPIKPIPMKPSVGFLSDIVCFI